MPPEPKKPIEQMLEALAKARRAQFGDDPKMPNPMRARLHEEIARGGAAEDENNEPRPSWITMFWPRLTVAAALATLIVLVPAIWWNQSRPVSGVANVAVRDRAAGAVDQLNPAKPAENTVVNVPGVSVLESRVNLADNSQMKLQSAATPSSEAEASESTHLAGGRAATEFPNQVTDKEIADAKTRAASAPAPATAPPAAQPSSAGDVAMTQQFSRQSALQSFRNNAQVRGAANVLNTFQVQQEGTDIRVVDADGSTYTGKIEQSAKNAELDSSLTARRDVAKQTRSYAAKAAPVRESAVPQSSFRATGYNLSLKKTLVFEGNYAASPAQQPASTSNDRARGEQSRDRARILGTVRVNGEAPVEVDAIAETQEPAATKKSEK